jgi:hypothetical protein
MPDWAEMAHWWMSIWGGFSSAVWPRLVASALRHWARNLFRAAQFLKEKRPASLLRASALGK